MVDILQHIRSKLSALTESEAHHYLLDHGIYLSANRLLENNLTIAQIIWELDKIETVASEFLDFPVESLHIPEFATVAALMNGMYSYKVEASELKNLLLIVSAVVGNSHELSAFMLDFIPDSDNNGFYPTYHAHPYNTFIRNCGYNIDYVYIGDNLRQ